MKKPIVILALIVTSFTSHSQNESYKDVLLEYMEVQGSLVFGKFTFNTTPFFIPFFNTSSDSISRGCSNCRQKWNKTYRA